jgi:hypothetical protein
VTEQELKRCRYVYRDIAARLRMIRAKLRTLVVDQDCLALGIKPNVGMLMLDGAGKMRCFRHCVDLVTAQTLDGFLKDTAKPELATITGPMLAVVSMCAEHAMKKRMTPAKAWSSIADGFDSSTKDTIAGLALQIVTTRPTVALTTDAAPPGSLREWVMST